MAERFPSFDIVAEEVKTQVEQQQSQFDALDTKAGIVLGFSGVLSALGGRVDGSVNGTSFGLAMIAALLAVLAFFPRRFPVIDLGTLRNEYLSADSKFTSLRLLDSRLAMWREGRGLLKHKARYLAGSLLFLTAAVFVQAFGILF